MGKMKEHYHDALTARSADEELFDMANNLENIEDEDEFWAEMRKIEDCYYGRVA